MRHGRVSEGSCAVSIPTNFSSCCLESMFRGIAAETARYKLDRFLYNREGCTIILVARGSWSTDTREDVCQRHLQGGHMDYYGVPK